MNWNNARFLTSYGSLGQMPESTLPEIAFSGRSNVGKSSLINKLLGRKALARVSSVPGKTVTINFYEIGQLHIVDLPGYGYAKTAKGLKRSWSDLIGGYLEADRDLRLVVQLIDIRHAPSKDDIQMIDFLIDTETPFIIAFTKADKLGTNARRERMEAFAEEIPQFHDIISVEFSAISGEGTDKLRELIESAAAD